MRNSKNMYRRPSTSRKQGWEVTEHTLRRPKRASRSGIAEAENVGFSGEKSVHAEFLPGDECRKQPKQCKQPKQGRAL